MKCWVYIDLSISDGPSKSDINQSVQRMLNEVFSFLPSNIFPELAPYWEFLSHVFGESIGVKLLKVLVLHWLWQRLMLATADL